MIPVKYSGYLSLRFLYELREFTDCVILGLRLIYILVSSSGYTPVNVYAYIALFCSICGPCKYVLKNLSHRRHISYESVRYLVLNADLEIDEITVHHGLEFVGELIYEIRGKILLVLRLYDVVLEV